MMETAELNKTRLVSFFFKTQLELDLMVVHYF